MLVSAGLGVAMMPEFLPILSELQTRLVIEPEVHRDISMVTVAGRPHTRPVAIAVRTAQAHRRVGAPEDKVVTAQAGS